MKHIPVTWLKVLIRVSLRRNYITRYWWVPPFLEDQCQMQVLLHNINKNIMVTRCLKVRMSIKCRTQKSVYAFNVVDEPNASLRLIKYYKETIKRNFLFSEQQISAWQIPGCLLFNCLWFNIPISSLGFPLTCTFSYERQICVSIFRKNLFLTFKINPRGWCKNIYDMCMVLVINVSLAVWRCRFSWELYMLQTWQEINRVSTLFLMFYTYPIQTGLYFSEYSLPRKLFFVWYWFVECGSFKGGQGTTNW